MKSSAVLDGVVAFVSVTNAGGMNASSAFAKHLAAAGAKVSARLSKDVTHVVFKGSDDDLRGLYDRLEKVTHLAIHEVVNVSSKIHP